jgi:hypothetical protein
MKCPEEEIDTFSKAAPHQVPYVLSRPQNGHHQWHDTHKDDTRVYPKVSGLSHNEIYAYRLLLVEKQHKGLWRQNSLTDS